MKEEVEEGGVVAGKENIELIEITFFSYCEILMSECDIRVCLKFIRQNIFLFTPFQM